MQKWVLFANMTARLKYFMIWERGQEQQAQTNNGFRCIFMSLFSLVDIDGGWWTCALIFMVF